MTNKRGRKALRGAEVRTVDLIFEVLTSAQLAWLLRAPLELAADTWKRGLSEPVKAGAEIGDALHQAIQAGTQVDAMANKSGRNALRGIEARTLDLIFEVLTSEQWAELLRALLERAAAKGNRGLAQQLVRAGAQIGTALHKGARNGHGDIVCDLLESGASLAAKDTDGYTPLHVATQYGVTEMVQLLLLAGADKDAFNNLEWTPLYLAAYFGHSPAALALLAAGADVDLQCGKRTSAMFAAAEKGHVEIFRAIIEHGADVDAVASGSHCTALHSAAVFNKPQVIDMLVEVGANIEARDRNHLTPLHIASVALKREALICLLKHGANVNAEDEESGTSLMHAVYKAGTQGAAEVVDSLLRAGADETIVDDEGSKAADVIGEFLEEEDRLAEDVERVRKLLANAPADRAWRRRGYLVLCLAHPDRVQQNQVTSGAHHADTARETRSRAGKGRRERGR